LTVKIEAYPQLHLLKYPIIQYLSEPAALGDKCMGSPLQENRVYRCVKHHRVLGSSCNFGFLSINYASAKFYNGEKMSFPVYN
jgi:hypothetical protein